VCVEGGLVGQVDRWGWVDSGDEVWGQMLTCGGLFVKGESGAELGNVGWVLEVRWV